MEVGEDENVVFNTSGEFNAGSNNGNLQIELSQSNTRSNTVMDNAIVSFNEGSQLGKFYFGEQNANIYIPQNGKEYAIAYSEGQGEMPVNFKAKENGTYTLSFSGKEVGFNYLHLIDNLTGADVDLLQTPSYSFEARTDDYASRFKLVFSTGNAESNDNFAFISNGEIIVNGEGTLQVLDMTGRVLSSRNATNRIGTDGLAAGVYVLRLINGENVKTQKVVIQ